MFILIYSILGIITLVTSIITFFTYKKQNPLFKFWLILLVFNITILLLVLVSSFLLGGVNKNIDIGIEDPTIPIDQPAEPPNNNVPINETEANNSSTNQKSSHVVMLLILAFAIFSLNSLLAIFVFRDSSARTGITGAVAWAVVTFFTSIIGLGLYLLIRPSGNIVICTNCKKLALDTIPICLHCYSQNKDYRQNNQPIDDGNETLEQ